MIKRTTHICLNEGKILCNSSIKTLVPKELRRIHINFVEDFLPYDLIKEYKFITKKIANILFDYFPAYYLCRYCLMLYVEIKIRGYRNINGTIVNPTTKESYKEFRESFSVWLEKQDKKEEFLCYKFIPKYTLEEIKELRKRKVYPLI